MTINNFLVEMAVKKANNSNCRFKVSAIGISAKGNVLGSCINNHRFDGKGRGLHAEINLIRRFGKKLSTIIICRVGRSGEMLPIDPCDNCQKVADKLGIKIISVRGRECIDGN